MFHDLQTGMGPGITVLQEKGCLLLWSDSGSLSLRLSQSHHVAVRVDGLSRFQEIQKNHPIQICSACTGADIELMRIVWPVNGSWAK